MPDQASPETHLAAGPWCFAGQEARFPGWEEHFAFAPEPLRDLAALRACARGAQALCLECLPALARRLCAHADDLPPVYWQTLLMPWAMEVAKQMVERWLRVKAMTGAWGELPLAVPMLPRDCLPEFATEHDFTLRGALGPRYNHWLFSRLLENAWPAAWQREMLPAAPRQPARTVRPGLRERLRGLALALPFPPMKGMRPAQALRFSAALLHPARGEDKSIDPQKLIDARADAALPDLPVDPLEIFMPSLPASIRRLRHPSAISQGSLPARTRAASIIAYEDAAYRQRLALWRARGNRIFYVQHGGNYGQVAVACETELVEYIQSSFITWGWHRQNGCAGNFIPLPYPQLEPLARLRKSAPKTGALLFVGTEMPAYPYRLDAHPTPLQVLDYRLGKERFFRALGSDLTSKTCYRPYFRLPGTFLDAEWLLPRFPSLRECRGPLLPALLGCRLFVADHHGTTMLEALAADIPSVFYWDRKAWPLTKEADRLLDGLERAGIWFPSPEGAARQVKMVWEDPDSWWHSSAVQAERTAYARRHALTVTENPDRLWINTLKTL